MTYRERRLAKAERLQEWADKRTVKANAAYNRAHTMADAIPFGQPIITGRGARTIADINYRERIQSTYAKALEHSNKADDMEGRAAGIIAQADRAIYDDDPDAIEALTAKIAALEAQRDAIKAYNASCRKGAPDHSLLTDELAAQIDSVLRHVPYQSKGGAFPPYATAYASAGIKKAQERIRTIQAQQVRLAAVDETGVSIERFPQHNWAQVTFAEKPARDILESLKGAGFSYSKGTWHGYLDKLPKDGQLT